MENITFTFPFTFETLVVVLIAYLLTIPLFNSRFLLKIRLVIYIVSAVIISIIFPWGYGLRLLLGVAIILASRTRLRKGMFTEVQIIVVSLVNAILFAGLR